VVVFSTDALAEPASSLSSPPDSKLPLNLVVFSYENFCPKLTEVPRSTAMVMAIFTSITVSLKA